MKILLPVVAGLATLVFGSSVAEARQTCAGCSGRLLPDGTESESSGRVGLTTLRIGNQYVGGDGVFKGSRRDETPPATSDVDWHRWVTSLEVYHQFTAKIGGGIGLPIYDQVIHNNVSGQDSRGHGIGDTLFYAFWTPWEEDGPRQGDELWDLRNISLMGGMSVPTGNELEGEIPALHNYHLGSGSVEFKFAARYDAWVSPSLRFFTELTMTVDGGPDTIGFRYGNGYGFQAGVNVGIVQGLRAIGSFDAVVRDHDKLNTIELPDTGGTWTFGILGLLWSPFSRFWVEPQVAFPIYWNVNGIQPVSDRVYTLGVRYQF
jgi:hypothetical protein